MYVAFDTNQARRRLATPGRRPADCCGRATRLCCFPSYFPGQNIISNTLLTAFENAHYVVFAPDEALVLRISQYSPALERLLLTYGVTTAAILTAYNPRAHTVSDEANRGAQAQLQRKMDELGLLWLEGENRAESDDGPCEPTVVALGIAREQSEQLAQGLGQLAFVYVDASGQPDLVWVHPY